MITLKSKREIERMRPAGQLVAEAHAIAREMIQPGVTTREIDQEIEKLFESRDAIPLFKGFPGKTPFPAVTCISVNEVVVHGIPGDRVLQQGDIVSVDTGCKINGWCGDAAWSYPCGEVDADSQRLLDVGKQTLAEAVQGLSKQKRWSAIARKMMSLNKANGFSLVTSFVGHGIGREMHEQPQVSNVFERSSRFEDFQIQPGLVLAIEPMINAGTPKVKILKDHWTAVTADGSRSVHFEHTIAVTEEGPLLLTEGVGTPLW